MITALVIFLCFVALLSGGAAANRGSGANPTGAAHIFAQSLICIAAIAGAVVLACRFWGASS